MVNIDSLKIKLLQIMASNLYELDDIQYLIQAFRVLDEENKGYLTVDQIQNFVTNRTTFGSIPFRSNELEIFIEFCRNKENDLIYYDDYLQIVSEEIFLKSKRK